MAHMQRRDDAHRYLSLDLLRGRGNCCVRADVARNETRSLRSRSLDIVNEWARAQNGPADVLCSYRK